MRLFVASAALVLLAAIPVRAVAGSDVLALDAAGMIQLENRADHAAPREQCFLYTELVEVYTMVAEKQLAAGEIEQASATFKRVESYAERIHMNLAKDTKRVKNAEKKVETASFRLGQFLRQVSAEDRAVVQTTLKKLNVVHDELLAQVFAH